jgi:hypothetical protein
VSSASFRSRVIGEREPPLRPIACGSTKPPCIAQKPSAVTARAEHGSPRLFLALQVRLVVLANAVDVKDSCGLTIRWLTPKPACGAALSVRGRTAFASGCSASERTQAQAGGRDSSSHIGRPREGPHGSCWFVLAGGNMEGGWAGRFLSPGLLCRHSAQRAAWPAQPSSSYGGGGQADSSIRSDPAGRRSLRRAYCSASFTTSTGGSSARRHSAAPCPTGRLLPVLARDWRTYDHLQDFCTEHRLGKLRVSATPNRARCSEAPEVIAKSALRPFD